MKGKLIKISSVFATTCSVIDVVLHNLYPCFLGLHIPVVFFNHSYILACIAVGSHTRYDT